ncbi:transporter substrate-binding domain-containing protein [Periweissella cryptocerci]|uniref:Transporter substrate-binding domain-containing protein n=1 Tax=Periweissella cryptocerci TaxID=2506420 RepID=A0A4P6YRA5_9LACO|nr:ABC transporter substrate-binding protein/permease [Periweissella cryptocerci]QBO35122.1 transporter substrate-binding domain-containing protein [Periweissella cryptocerci]
MKKQILHLMLVVSMVLGMFVSAGSAFADAAPKTDSTLQAIKKKKVLVVGLSADYAPYEFHQTIKGQDQIVGFDISMAQAVAKKLGVQLKIQEMAYDALLGALTTGKIDMIISGMSPTPERAKEVNFSKTYISVGQVMLINKKDKDKYKAVTDFKGQSVAAQKGTVQETIATQQITGDKPVSLTKFTDAIMQLKTDKVAGVVAESPVADAYAQHDKDLYVQKMSFSTEKGATAIAMPKGANALTAQVNQVIDKVHSDGSFAKWQKKANAEMFQSQSFFGQYGSYFISGTGLTLALAAIGVFFGALLGTVLALMKRAHVKGTASAFGKAGKSLAKGFSYVYVEYVRGTPLMVQVYMIFFGATALFHLNINAFSAGAIAVSLNSAAYVSEIIRSGINSIADGQTEAARSLGMSESKAMRFVILPQAVKNILPALGNEFVTVIKESSVVSVIGVGELMFKTATVQGASFKPFLPLVVTSIIYFVLTFSLSRLLGLLEKKFNMSDKHLNV